MSPELGRIASQGVKPGSPVREIRTPGSEGGGGTSVLRPYEGTRPKRVPSRRTVGQPSDTRPPPTYQPGAVPLPVRSRRAKDYAVAVERIRDTKRYRPYLGKGRKG